MSATLTNEERARIARENGAKSRGPVTPEGKAKSSQNARKDDDPEREAKLACFIPAHPAALCHEDRSLFDDLIHELIAIYHPSNQVALSIVNDIGAARWQIDRLQRCLTMHYNLALIDAAKAPATLTPELHPMQFDVRASAAMLLGDAILSRFNREIDRLQRSISRLERRLLFVLEHFPDAAPLSEKQTQADEENKDVIVDPAEKDDQNEPAIFVTENTPAVIEAYRQEFPERKIVVLRPDNVAKGIDDYDDFPLAPRRPT